MSDFEIVLDTDTGGVVSHRFLEIPISGPGKANRLVTITGIAIPNADYNSHLDEPVAHGDIFIHTDYQLKALDAVDGLVDGNRGLLAATYASLASISYVAEEGIGDPTSAPAFTAAVDSVAAGIDKDRRIVVHLVVGVQGKPSFTTIHRISYQANILIQKAG